MAKIIVEPRFSRGGIYMLNKGTRKLATVFSLQAILLIEELVKVKTMTQREIRTSLLGSRKAPLTGSERASISRSLRRLINAGTIARTKSGITITAKGMKDASMITDWRKQMASLPRK